jgi:hypothetical protein
MGGFVTSKEHGKRKYRERGLRKLCHRKGREKFPKIIMVE